MNKAVMASCAAVVICFAAPTLAQTCCRYDDDPPDIDVEVAQLCDLGPPASDLIVRTARHSLCVDHRHATASHQARIGMTSEMARQMWGESDHINSSILATGATDEQWVYPADQYLYFRDGTLTAIQTTKRP